MGLFIVLFFTVRAVALNGTAYFETISYVNSLWWIVMGVIVVILFFFRLRVFDEIKDYDLDCKNHPHRVLQSGRVTLKQLQLISYALIPLEFIWSYLSGETAMICWIIAVAYSILMRYEFFVPTFLKSRLILYGVSHMMIMPLIILWVYAAHTGYELSNALWYLCGASLLAGFSFEIARKIHAPSDERDGVDSYSKSMGFKPAVITLLVILIAGLFVQFLLLEKVEAHWIVIAFIGIIYLSIAFQYLRNLVVPQEKGLRIGELLVSVFMIVSYLSVIIVVNLK